MSQIQTIMSENKYIVDTLKRLEKMINDLPCDDDDNINSFEVPEEYVEDYYKLKGFNATLALKKERKEASQLSDLMKRVDELEKKEASQLSDLRKRVDELEKE